MFNKLEETKKRYEFLTDEIVKPEVIANQNEWKKLVKERADIEEIVNKYAEYKEAEKNFEDCKAMMSDDDADIRELAKEEYDSFKTALDNVTEELKVLLIPKDPNDDKNVVIEIRGGAGGDEAALFGAELMRMYMHYADAKRWKVEEISSNMTELGGVKEVVFMVSGKGVYSNFQLLGLVSFFLNTSLFLNTIFSCLALSCQSISCPSGIVIFNSFVSIIFTIFFYQ